MENQYNGTPTLEIQQAGYEQRKEEVNTLQLVISSLFCAVLDLEDKIYIHKTSDKGLPPPSNGLSSEEPTNKISQAIVNINDITDRLNRLNHSLPL